MPTSVCLIYSFPDRLLLGRTDFREINAIQKPLVHDESGYLFLEVRRIDIRRTKQRP